MNNQLLNASQNIDLTNCDREPIHIPGRVQSFGCLVSVTADWIVNYASQNAIQMLGLSQEALVGSPLPEIFSEGAIHAVRSRLQMLSSPDAVERLFGIEVISGGKLFDIAVHLSGRTIVMEFEHSDEEQDVDYSGYVRPMMDRINQTNTIDKLTNIAARQIKAITGFDRVMVYKFDESDSGEVIAEAKSGDLEPFLGLRYPASDIPKQARALYLRNHLRIISDVDDAGIAIEPTVGPTGDPLDLSMSTVRAVSPIHLEYLRNMGVGASMSISIIRRGKLWGLFACHHTEPKILSFKLRSTLELFAQLFSYALDQKENDVEQQQIAQSRVLHDRIMAQLAEGSTIAKSFDQIVDAIGDVVSFDGVAGWLDGEFQSQGSAPTREEFLGLVSFLNTAAASQVYATNQLSKFHPPAADYAERASGVLALPVSRTPRDYIVLFRREIAKSVNWAGNPEKPVEVGKNGVRLTPRKSFSAWKEVVRNQSENWSKTDIQTADGLRVTLLEVVLRMADEAMKERSRAENQQELLIAELNHRVRNILNLIRGIFNQSQDDARDIAEFTKVIGGRIHSLSRAHDQITKENWAPASLHELLQTETQAYLLDKADRLVITGTDAMLEPNAFTTISLVLHELMTNSIKYGALMNSKGTVSVDIKELDDKALQLTWTETGGPPVVAPQRKGFGTTIIERSIPFELKGKAEVQFNVSGMSAKFLIPDIHVARFEKPSTKLEKVKTKTPKQGISKASSALIVEDNMIIAMDAEDLLRNMNCSTVEVASSVGQAMVVLSERKFDFALLDVNLGAETSEPIARHLKETNIPFAFTTGYGDLRELGEKFPGVPIVQKPYNEPDFEKVVLSLIQ